jgi:hypothetical protein
MGLKEKSYKMIMSIPHLALLWDMRRHQRYELREGLDIEIKCNEVKIYSLLLDICIGGMRIVSTDKRIEESKTLSISVNDFSMELPCKKIRRIGYYYGIIFDSMEEQEFTELEYFIEHFTKESSNHGLSIVLK